MTNWRQTENRLGEGDSFILFGPILLGLTELAEAEDSTKSGQSPTVLGSAFITKGTS